MRERPSLRNTSPNQYGASVQMPWSARIYQRTCTDCSFVWQVPKAVAKPRMQHMPASGRRGAAMVRAAVIAANAALAERAASFRPCPRCESVKYKQVSVRS